MPMNDTTSTIEELSDQYRNAIQRQDIAKITQLYTDEPRFMPRGGDIPRFDPIPEGRWSKEYINNYWKNVFQIVQNSFKYVQSIKDVEGLGDLAYQIGTYSLAAFTGVGDDLEEGTYFILWKRENEQWKMAVHILNTASSPKWAKSG